MDGYLNGDPNKMSYLNNRKMKVYDKKYRRWRQIFPSEIPWNFTYARRPRTFRQEAKLCLRVAHLVKHRFIWANEHTPEISIDDFTKLKSKGNAENYGRYSFFNY